MKKRSASGRIIYFGISISKNKISRGMIFLPSQHHIYWSLLRSALQKLYWLEQQLFFFAFFNLQFSSEHQHSLRGYTSTEVARNEYSHLAFLLNGPILLPSPTSCFPIQYRCNGRKNIPFPCLSLSSTWLVPTQNIQQLYSQMLSK